jgi:hypothetical protein
VCVCVYAHGPDRLRQQHAGLAPSVSAKCTLRRAVPSPTLSHWRPSRVVVVVVAFACAATYCVDSSRKSWQFGSTRASEITIHTKSVPQTGRLVCRWHTRAFDWIGLALSLRLLSTTPVLRCMNPSGMRAAVQRPLDAPETHHPGRSRNSNSSNRPLDSASTNSYRSTHSSRSSVLERAREYNRRVEQQNHRSKSLERTTTSTSEAGSLASRTYPSSAAGSRSQSASRATPHARLGTRERAMASVRKERNHATTTTAAAASHTPPGMATSRHAVGRSTSYTQPSTPVSAYSRPDTETATPQSNASRRMWTETPSSKATQSLSATKMSPTRSLKSARSSHKGEAVVSPELLVDALSGHEDGLLAIAERLMEHYDGGYDVMGEAIIDAFADVQKLFQHVVEAAHMEGAAFEASRCETEMAELRRQAAAGELSNGAHDDLSPRNPTAQDANTPGAPTRHDEFIDQDVKDILTEAIRQGAAFRDQNAYTDCLELYEQACQEASAMLPVDSDHRGRLQLSIARTESMSAERACAILRYAMDDVLRSGLRVGRTPLPDPSKRADVVLSKPLSHLGVTGGLNGQAGVVQSSVEALASLTEEMKEIMGAPVYADTPLQAVAHRFWIELNEAQKSAQKNEARLEQNLGKLKGDFLLAKAEWEEKLSQSNETADSYKQKYERMKEQHKHEQYMDQARSFPSRVHDDDANDTPTMYGSVRSAASGKAGSVASGVSGLAQHAKSIVNSMNSMNCAAMSDDRASPQMNMDELEIHSASRGRSSSQRFSNRSSPHLQPPHSAPRNKLSKSFREYSKSPQRMDV